MAAKKKTNKKKTTSMTTAPKKKMTRVKKTAAKRATSKKSVKRKEAQKKAPPRKKIINGKTVPKRGVAREPVRKKNQTVNPAIPAQRRARALSGGQSGDLQGLSRVQGADSESVEELIEEGNAFEADVVTGVENADDTDEKEVRTHEVREDDVPEEYLDKD